MDSYYVKPRIYMEREGLNEILKGRSKALIITDKFMYESGKVNYVTDICLRMGVEVSIFAEVKPDPDIATITNGITQMTNFKPDVLFALGGGSAIDCAKAMNYLAAKEGMMEKAFFVAIPTTSGTGSEVTSFAVISDPDAKAKYPLISDDLLPEAAVLDAELTKTVPASITADTGIDVLTHAIEAYVSVKANDFTDAAAEKSMKIVFEHLEQAVKAASKKPEELTPEDLRHRQKMHNASCLAGMAFSNAGLGINHSMAHALGGHFHIPHGRANGILLPYVMQFNCGCKTSLTPASDRYARMSKVLWLDSGTHRENAFGTIRATKQLVKRVGIPKTIKDQGVKEKDFMDALDGLVEAALADSCTATNPKIPTREEMRELFLTAYKGNNM
ncbi:MAG: 1-propanol dehydrogenase PduQ [Eubacteriales bacterium]|nr:1-propanol dehydrogenase PduQ [Eubacteriales bacterium]